VTQPRTETASVEVGGKETSTGWIPATAGMGWGTGCDVKVKKRCGRGWSHCELTASLPP